MKYRFGLRTARNYLSIIRSCFEPNNCSHWKGFKSSSYFLPLSYSNILQECRAGISLFNSRRVAPLWDSFLNCNIYCSTICYTDIISRRNLNSFHFFGYFRDTIHCNKYSWRIWKPVFMFFWKTVLLFSVVLIICQNRALVVRFFPLCTDTIIILFYRNEVLTNRNKLPISVGYQLVSF